MSAAIRFENVSKFYGEVLGVNRVDLELQPGIVGLVGPNGSGKSTLLNLMTGLLRPTQGRIEVLGVRPDQPEALFRKVGYCTQFDAFPRGETGRAFVESMLRLFGRGRAWARDKAAAAIEQVGLTEHADRPIAAFSKGMRQRIKLAQCIAHDPEVLILDEPLNGLDPMARAEVIALFRRAAADGRFVIISSHILHEVDMVSDRVVLLQGGYVVADGGIETVREEVRSQPLQVLLRCDRPSILASRLFSANHMVEARVQEDGQGLLVRTEDADHLHLLLNRIVNEEGLSVEGITPADSDVQAVYRYLIEEEES